MSEINVKGINKDQFGTKMPNVFINRVSLNYAEVNDYSGNPATEFTFNLTLKFSKPEHLQARTAREFISKNLRDVYLYAFLTDEDWVKGHLEEDRFSLEYWHTYAMMTSTITDPFSRYRRIPIASFADKDNFYDVCASWT